MPLLLDNANIIALLALQIAVWAAFSTLVIAYVSHYVSGRITTLENASTARKHDEFQLVRAAEVTTHVFVRMDNLIVFHHLLLSRILDNRNIPRDAVESYRYNFVASRRELNKLIQTLLIYSEEREPRRSALKQLSEDLGGVDTLHRLVELQAYEGELGDDLRRAIRALEDRLGAGLDRRNLGRARNRKNTTT